MGMILDKALYQQAYRAYREWNEAEAAARARDAAQFTPSEAWRRYVALVEFCWRLSPEPSRHQRQQKLAALDRYYAAVQRLEDRKRADESPKVGCPDLPCGPNMSVVN